MTNKLWTVQIWIYLEIKGQILSLDASRYGVVYNDVDSKWSTIWVQFHRFPVLRCFPIMESRKFLPIRD